MKYYTTLVLMLLLLIVSKDTTADSKFKCEKHISELSLVYYGDTAVDVLIYDDNKKKGAVIQNFSAIEKGDILNVIGLSEVKKQSLWELFEAGTNNKIGESLFDLKCNDKEMDEPDDCGNLLGNGKKKDKNNQYQNTWLFNGLVDEKGNAFSCDLPETHQIPPKVTLLGNAQIALEIGDDFIDPGAQAEDNLDGDITAYITTETNLDILKVGVYQVTYTVVDSDGNKGNAERSVTVSDENVKMRVLQNRIAASSDDAEEDTAGKVTTTSSDLEIVEDYKVLQTNTVGLRFYNLNIPENSIITKAYIQFKVDEVSVDYAQFNIYAELHNFAPTFNNAAFNISARNKTQNFVQWTPEQWPSVGTLEQAQQTPDLTAIVQEVVTEKGFINSLAFILDGVGTRTAESYDGDVDGAPLLYVEYEAGAVIQTLSVAPNIRRMLPVNALNYELVNAPDKGILEINQETQDFVYLANAGTSGRDVIKFKRLDNPTDPQSLIFNIVLNPAPVMLNGVELAEFSSNLPLMIFDTNNNPIPDEPKIKGVLTVISPIDAGRSSLTTLPDYSDYMEIELRGSSSLQFAKKGYGLDTEMIDGEDNDVPLLGMPEEHKWTLHGPYSDKSLMRNYIAYNKTRDMGGYAAVRSKFVEVLIREGNSYSYEGVYVFAEKIKRDKNRVDIAKLKSTHTQLPEISGGYIMSQDRPKDDWYFDTLVKGSRVVMEYPKTEDLNDQQKAYIQDFMNSFENALFASDFNQPSSANYYENFIEPDSFAKHLLSRELFSDVDAWYFSEFFHKDRDGKLSMLPVWDFNLSMGNVNYRYNGSTVGWRYNGRASGTGSWMNKLMEDSKFENSVKSKWLELRSGPWSDANLNGFIDETKDLLQEAQARNFERWPVLGEYVWPNRLACDGETAYCDTWDKAVDEHLRAWLLARAAWMDANL